MSLLFFAVVGNVATSSMLHTKDLAGEPMHFPMHTLPSPSGAAVTARGVMLRAPIGDAASGVGFQVGPGRTEMFTLSLFMGDFESLDDFDVRLDVKSPNGTSFLPSKIVRESLGYGTATGQDCTSFSYVHPPTSSGLGSRTAFD